MERRRDTRYKASQPVRLTVLDEDPASPQTVEGIILDYSERGLRVAVREPLASGTALQIEFQSQVLAGEACYCQPLGRKFALGIELQQALKNMDDLSHLMLALSEDPPRVGPSPRRAA